MGWATRFVLVVAVALGPVTACGDVTESDQTTAGAPGGMSGAAGGGRKSEPRGRSKAGRNGANATHNDGGAEDDDADNAPPMDILEHPCTICARADNCCKARGLADCNLAPACASAGASEQYQFYLVLCSAALNASGAGVKTPPDTCSF